MAQCTRLENPYDHMPSAYLMFSVLERPVDPPSLDGVLDLRRQIGDRGRAARQSIQRRGHVGSQPCRIDLKMLDDAMQVRIIELQNLLDPVNQLDIRITAQLAKDGRSFK